MAKYYVQSGNVRTIVSADEPEKAALWVIHKTLQQVIPVYEEAESSPAEKVESAQVQGILVLGNEVLISELGFDRSDSLRLDTFELLVHWNQLMVALDRLSAHLQGG